MYRELLGGYISNHNWARLQNPCSEDDIQATEKYVGFSFPEELKNLLRETNGDHWLLMSTSEIREKVKSDRDIYPEYLDDEEFEEKIMRYIFFATNGCGDYYCYKVNSDGLTEPSAIYFWQHENFEACKISDSIEELISKYYSDEI